MFKRTYERIKIFKLSFYINNYISDSSHIYTNVISNKRYGVLASSFAPSSVISLFIVIDHHPSISFRKFVDHVRWVIMWSTYYITSEVMNIKKMRSTN